jgi:hypothetical protein
MCLGEFRHRGVAALPQLCCRRAVEVRQSDDDPIRDRNIGSVVFHRLSAFSWRQFVCEVREVRLNDRARLIAYVIEIGRRFEEFA